MHYAPTFWFFVLVGILIRLYYLNRPVYLDESATFLDYARLSFWQAGTTYFDPNNHPFYSVLMHGSYLLFGFSPPALRLPAFLAGVAILPLTYMVGRWLYNERVGLLAAGLAAVSAPLIEYSVSGRGYTLITAAALLLLWLPSRVGAWRWWVFAVVSALGFYTLPTMLYAMGVVALWWGLRYMLRQDWHGLLSFGAALVGGALLTLLLWSPILREYGLSAVAGNRHIVPLTYGELLPALIRLPRDLLDYLALGLPRLLRYALVIPLLASLWASRTSAEDRPVPLMAAAGLWLVAWIAVQRVIPPTRVWVWLAPLVALWVAAGVDAMLQMLNPTPKSPPRSQRGDLQAPRLSVFRSPYTRLERGLGSGVYLLIPLIWGVFVLTSNVNGGYDISSGAHDAQAAAAYIAEELPPDAPVLFVAGWVHPLWYYLATYDLPRDRVWLNAGSLNREEPLYLLAFTEDAYRDERTQEAFGVVFTADELTPVVTFPNGEWTLYHIEPPR